MAFIDEYSYNYTFDYNDTYHYDIFEEAEISSLSSDIIIIGVYYIIIFCISASGNSFILWGLLRERGWKKTPDNLILQLTVSALCYTVTLPFQAFNELYGWVLGQVTCGVIVGATHLGTYSCIWIITAMTFYHYVAVDHASCLSAQASKKLLLLTSTVIWLISGAASIILSINSSITEINHMRCYVSLHRWMMYHSLIQFGFFLIPFIIITFCYVYRATKQCTINRQHQASRLILGITIGLFLCMGPYDILTFIFSLEWFGIVDVKFWWLPDSVWFIISLLPHTHCCLNLVHICGAQRFSRYLCMTCDRREETRDVTAMAALIQNDISV